MKSLTSFSTKTTMVPPYSFILSLRRALITKIKSFAMKAANTFTIAALITGVGLTPVALFAEQSNHQWKPLTAKPDGFITTSYRRAPGASGKSSADMINRLCAPTASRSENVCPPGLKGAPGFPDPNDDFSAELPHLRLNIVLWELQNIVVSGSGVDSSVSNDVSWVNFRIESSTADDAIPGPADPTPGSPLPPPGNTWSLSTPHTIYQGIIENGCTGSPATFDLTLDSAVYRNNTSHEFGEVHLTDEVEGHGYYKFRYTIRATDEDGNVSDFVFSGDANAYCTSQSAF